MDFAIFWGVSAVNIQCHLHGMFLPGAVQVLHLKISNAFGNSSAFLWHFRGIPSSENRNFSGSSWKSVWVSHNAHRTQGVQRFLWQIPEWIFQETTLLVLDKLQLTFRRCCSKHVKHKEPQKHAFHFGTRK